MAVSTLEHWSAATPALDAYEAFAPFYDEFTASYAHEDFLASVEELARAHGLVGRRVLDVGCGTGKSSAPLLARGYDVSACDISPAMVARARERLGGDPERVFVADMRALPPGGDFDLVTCLDDALNYLLSEDDLDAALRSFARVLRPGGLAAFDANSLATYRSVFTREEVAASDDTIFRLCGETSADVRPGDVCELTIEILRQGGDGRSRRATSRHVQRHHPRESVESACERAGLRCVAVRGQMPGGRLVAGPDEDRHPKLLYLVRKPDARANRGWHDVLHPHLSRLNRWA